MSSIPSRTLKSPLQAGKDVTALIPDFPFHYRNFLDNANGLPLCNVPMGSYGKKVLVVGAGISGLVAAYELLRMGLHPVVMEASERIGGRLYSKRLGNPDNPVICELGGMRFPVSAKTLYYYFDKVGMSSNSTEFPNPGTSAAVSTVVDYNGDAPVYYEAENPNFKKPAKYEQIESQFFSNFLGGEPFYFEEMEKAMTEGSLDQLKIKQIWNNLIGTEQSSWDDVSFFAALKKLSGWNREDIELFGQIGFGTGGWNTDFPNSILELLRVMYGGLDADHRLMYDGSSSLPQRLWSAPPDSLGDTVVHWPAGTSVEILTKQVIPNPFNKEVRYITPNTDGSFSVVFFDAAVSEEHSLIFDAVIYTPHVRILDKLRYSDSQEDLNKMDTLLSKDMWEAVMYTHYMQTTKIFAATNSPFWEVRDEAGKRSMSVTLSDRLTRGTYLVDYSGSSATDNGSGIFLSYVWNDDSLKFLGNKAQPYPQPEALCLNLLETIYPNIDLQNHLTSTNTFTRITWENEPYYLGAFKMNLPGQYEYQRRLFSQFMEGIDENNPYGFVLAGDDISWVAGWAEGAVTTALNAVNKIAVRFGGGTAASNPGPVDMWSQLKPIKQTA